MNALLEQEPLWTPRRWSFIILGILTIQVLLVVWLSDRQPAQVRTPSRAPTLQWAGSGLDEILSLSDPTLFALPSANGFSGLAWLSASWIPTPSTNWIEPMPWLQPSILQLASHRSSFYPSVGASLPQGGELPLPQPVLPQVAPMAPLIAESALRVEGNLTGRKLLSQVSLKPWAHTDLLTPTTVQLLVDAQGEPRSSTLLLPGSGLKVADDYALEIARSLRFESLPADKSGTNLVARLTWGQLVFEWQTLQVASTNSATAK